MRVIREIEVAGQKIQVRELTLAEIRTWFKKVSSPENGGDLVDATLFEEFSVSDLSALTNLTGKKADSLTPSEIREVVAVAKEVNADFFAMRGRLVQLGRQIVAGSSSG